MLPARVIFFAAMAVMMVGFLFSLQTLSALQDDQMRLRQRLQERASEQKRLESVVADLRSQRDVMQNELDARNAELDARLGELAELGAAQADAEELERLRVSQANNLKNLDAKDRLLEGCQASLAQYSDRKTICADEITDRDTQIDLCRGDLALLQEERTSLLLRVGRARGKGGAVVRPRISVVVLYLADGEAQLRDTLDSVFATATLATGVEVLVAHPLHLDPPDIEGAYRGLRVQGYDPGGAHYRGDAMAQAVLHAADFAAANTMVVLSAGIVATQPDWLETIIAHTGAVGSFHTLGLTIADGDRVACAGIDQRGACRFRGAPLGYGPARDSDAMAVPVWDALVAARGWVMEQDPLILDEGPMLDVSVDLPGAVDAFAPRDGAAGEPQWDLDLAVVWDLYCSCTGLNIEAINFLVPLEERVRRLGAVAGPDCFCPGFPDYFHDALDRVRLAHPVAPVVDVWISHKPPPSFPRFPYTGLVTYEERPRVIVGRAMTEVRPISAEWADACERVDEVWVPSEFSAAEFARAGVPASKIFKVPEALDVALFDPAITRPLEVVAGDDAERFRFLSVFKWEPRKGWDVLLRAYVSEFGADEDVVLYLHTYLYGSAYMARSVAAVERKIDTFVRDELGRDPRQVAPIRVLTTELPEREMPRLYKAMDAFVLPSRGEGWGLPLMEAMAMGLPTIGTNATGPTEFMRSDNSYLIPVTGWSPAEGFDDGQLWADPSPEALQGLMRTVFSSRRASREVGARGRATIATEFSQQAVAARVVERLQAHA